MTETQTCRICKTTKPATGVFFTPGTKPSKINGRWITQTCIECSKKKGTPEAATSWQGKEATIQTCIVCNEQKPATKAFFTKGSKKSSGAWITQTCVECHTRRKNVPSGHKFCGGCHQTLLLSEFSIIASGRPSSWCKSCHVNNSRITREGIPKSEIRAYSAAYRTRNAERVREWSRKYYAEKLATNPEFVAKERLRTAEKKRRNPGAYKAYKANRRARQQAARGELGAADVRAAFDRAQGCCAYCGVKLIFLSRRDWHVEHVIPLSRGGTNLPENITVACSRCNLSKGSKTPEEFLGSRMPSLGVAD